MIGALGKMIAAGLLAAWSISMAAGQNRCFDGEIVPVFRQAQLDSLMATVPECTVFEGNLLLLYDEQDPITSLAPFRNIEAFTVQLGIVEQKALDNLSGLENVRYINSFLFDENTMLRNFRGLENLEEIAGRFIIKRHDRLEDLSGFERLAVAGDQIDITFNERLKSLRGLDALERVEGRFLLGHNPSLEQVSGLQKLESVGEEIFIVSNGALETISGFTSLASAPTLVINDNSRLKEITGFTALTDVENVRVSNNDVIEDVSGLRSVDSRSVINFDFWNNGSLTHCHIESVCATLMEDASKVYIDNNAMGCNTEEEVSSQCIVSVEDVRSVESVTIYPNPSSGVFGVDLPSTVDITSIRVQLYTLTGQQQRVKTLASRGHIQVDASDARPGVYLLKVLAGDQLLTTTKIIIVE